MPASVFGSAVAASNTGTMRIMRTGPLVVVTITDVTLATGTGSTDFAWNSLPGGFRAVGEQQLTIAPSRRSSPSLDVVAYGAHLSVMGVRSAWGQPLSTTLNGHQVSGTAAFVTADPWPTSLPGTPVD